MTETLSTPTTELPQHVVTGPDGLNYFDNDVELFTLTDAAIAAVAAHHDGYPMELVGEECSEMAEYDTARDGSLFAGQKIYRTAYSLSTKALTAFLQEGRDGHLTEELEDLASSIAENLKLYMNEDE